MVATCDHVRARLKTQKRINLSFDEWNVWYQKRPNPHQVEDWQQAPRLLEDVYTVTDAVPCSSPRPAPLPATTVDRSRPGGRPVRRARREEPPTVEQVRHLIGHTEYRALQRIAEMVDHPRRGLDLCLESDQARAMDVDPEIAEHAVVFMEARGLLTVRRAMTDAPVRLALTVNGRDCLYQGGDVEVYVREREAETRTEFHVQGGQGHQFGNVGETITQTNTVQQGLGVQVLAALAELLRRYADDPRVDADDAEELRDIADDLGEDIQGGEVELGMARRRLARLRRVAARLVPALSVEVTAAVEQAAQLLPS